MKKKRNILLILTLIIFAWGSMFLTDLIRSKKNQPPIFCISFADYDVSKSYVGYTGLFYRVERTMVEVDGKLQREYKLLPWFY